MKWYAAHIIMYVKFRVHTQNAYPIWENVVLVHAETTNEAWEKAVIFGRQEEGDSQGTFTWDEKPAMWMFGGVRKLMECERSLDQHGENGESNALGEGSEITYSQFEVESEEALTKLIQGEPVTIYYEK